MYVRIKHRWECNSFGIPEAGSREEAALRALEFLGYHLVETEEEERETNEMRVLRELVAEFSPVHQNMVGKMNYAELFRVVQEIVNTHYEETE